MIPLRNRKRENCTLIIRRIVGRGNRTVQKWFDLLAPRYGGIGRVLREGTGHEMACAGGAGRGGRAAIDRVLPALPVLRAPRFPHSAAGRPQGRDPAAGGRAEGRRPGTAA